MENQTIEPKYFSFNGTDKIQVNKTYILTLPNGFQAVGYLLTDRFNILNFIMYSKKNKYYEGTKDIDWTIYQVDENNSGAHFNGGVLEAGLKDFEPADILSDEDMTSLKKSLQDYDFVDDLDTSSL